MSVHLRIKWLWVQIPMPSLACNSSKVLSNSSFLVVLICFLWFIAQKTMIRISALEGPPTNVLEVWRFGLMILMVLLTWPIFWKRTFSISHMQQYRTNYLEQSKENKQKWTALLISTFPYLLMVIIKILFLEERLTTKPWLHLVLGFS